MVCRAIRNRHATREAHIFPDAFCSGTEPRQWFFLKRGKAELSNSQSLVQYVFLSLGTGKKTRIRFAICHADSLEN